MVDLDRDPGEGLAGGRREVVPQTEEVGKEEGSEQAVAKRAIGQRGAGQPNVSHPRLIPKLNCMLTSSGR